MPSPEVIQQLQEKIQSQRDQIIRFMREICAFPSMESNIEDVGKRIGAEMKALHFDEVRFDKMGNIMGRIGIGKKVIVFDSHIDTVGIGDPHEWKWDPFEGKVEDGVLYARGACDEKGSTPGMVYGLSAARDLGLLEGWTAWYFGNMEEWCDGIAPNAFVEVDPGIRPDFVVIGEPTKMNVYRGHKGRIELKIVATGRSAHAATHYLGDNAVYKMHALISEIQELDRRMRFGMFSHPVLGHASITVTDAFARTNSLNAVPNLFTIFIDHRVTLSESREDALKTVRGLIADYMREEIKVEELYYDTPSYTGFTFPLDKFFPAWFAEESHPFVQAGQRTIKDLWGVSRPSGTWDFSTNGTYWAGKAKIPSIGFGPGNEVYAHTINEHVPLQDVVDATAFYALLPKNLSDIIDYYKQFAGMK
jgi:putative selenium metabolism hydrolase